MQTEGQRIRLDALFLKSLFAGWVGTAITALVVGGCYGYFISLGDQSNRLEGASILACCLALLHIFGGLGVGLIIASLRVCFHGSDLLFWFVSLLAAMTIGAFIYLRLADRAEMSTFRLDLLFGFLLPPVGGAFTTMWITNQTERKPRSRNRRVTSVRRRGGTNLN